VWGKTRLRFGADFEMVQKFVEADGLVKEFMGKYRGRDRTWKDHARALCLFFNWLRQSENIRLTPTELLNVHLQKSKSEDIEARRWACRLVLKFCRDNPVWKDKCDVYKRNMFIMVKQFFDYNNVPLAMSNGMYGKCRKRKYSPKQMSVQIALKVLGQLNQRERTVCMLMLQSGQSVDAVLNRINFMFDYIMGCLKNGQSRIRFDFSDRKGNSFTYFTFIGQDGIQELKKWLAVRQQWLDKIQKKSSVLFIMRNGQSLDVNKFSVAFNRIVRAKKLGDGPFSLTSHMFRKLFKTESSPPERGISQDYVEFMMGHLSGIESVGGIYDRTPELHEDVVEKEYGKLEPYLNIYSGRTSERNLSQEDMVILNRFKDPIFQAKLKDQQRLMDLLTEPEVYGEFKKWLETLKKKS